MDDVFRRPIGDPPASPDATRSDDDGPASLAPARDYRSDPSGSARGVGADVCSLGRQATALVAKAPAGARSRPRERTKPPPRRAREERVRRWLEEPVSRGESLQGPQRSPA